MATEITVITEMRRKATFLRRTIRSKPPPTAATVRRTNAPLGIAKYHICWRMKGPPEGPKKSTIVERGVTID